MKKIISLLLFILIIGVSFLWLLYLGSSHKIPSSTHIAFGLTLSGLLVFLFVIRTTGKSKTR